MKRVLLVLAGFVFGAGIAIAVPASAGTPTPTPVTPTPTPTVPVVNPFANCAFSVSEIFTFDPIRHRFVATTDPAIVCETRRGPRVYDLTPTPFRR